LANIGSHRSEVQESLNLCCLIIWPEVQVQPILDHPLVGYRNEEQARRDLGPGPNLELVVLLKGHAPIKCSCPPVTERPWIAGIDDDLLPRQDHFASISDTARPAIRGLQQWARIDTRPGQFGMLLESQNRGHRRLNQDPVALRHAIPYSKATDVRSSIARGVHARERHFSQHAEATSQNSRRHST